MTDEQKPEEKKSAWDDPSVVHRLIDEGAPLLKSLFEAQERANQAAAQSAKVVHNRVFGIAFGVVGAAGATAIIALLQDNALLAEKIIIPLISFAGGFGLGGRSGK